MQRKDINLGHVLIVVGVVFLVMAAVNPFSIDPGVDTSLRRSQSPPTSEIRQPTDNVSRADLDSFAMLVGEELGAAALVLDRLPSDPRTSKHLYLDHATTLVKEAVKLSSRDRTTAMRKLKEARELCRFIQRR